MRADARPVTENGRIFAFENGREVASLGPVFTECLRSAFALASLPEAKKGGRQAQGKNNPSTNTPD